MSEAPLAVLCVVGTPSGQAATRTVVEEISRRLRSLGVEVDIFDPAIEPLPLFDPESSYTSPGFLALKERVERADAFVLATPDYHGSVSSSLKNFLDHFWLEFRGKLFGEVVCSNEKGLTVIDQLRTVARQCYAWTLPYGVSFSGGCDVRDGKAISEALNARLEMFVHDLRSFGLLLRNQRALASHGVLPGFLVPRKSRDGFEESKSASIGREPSAPSVSA